MTIAETPQRPIRYFYPSTLDDLPPTEDWIQLFLDLARTAPSPYTTYKTSRRAHYDAARARAGIADYAAPAEVLMQDDKGMLSEGSLTTVYVRRGGRWITPDRTSGTNMGTTRSWALEMGLCVEGTVRMDSIRNGEHAWVSNGLKGFVYGIVSGTRCQSR